MVTKLVLHSSVLVLWPPESKNLQRRRQPKLTPVAVAIAAVDERRLQRLQASQRPRTIDDETEVIPTPPFSRTRTVASEILVFSLKILVFSLRILVFRLRIKCQKTRCLCCHSK